MENEIKDAIKLLKKNGYVVTKWTQEMEEAATECEKMIEEGDEKDCNNCRCCVCLM